MRNSMKRTFVVICFLFSLLLHAQDGTILEKKPFSLNDTIVEFLNQRDPFLAKRITDSVSFFRIVYLSDGLKVTGYLAEPKAAGKFPCIISNRGGNRDFGGWNARSIAYFLGQMASWNYLVVASQYRGNDGGEGMEEFGGKDINDVLNLLLMLPHLPKADTSRIGIEGTSRGGMMTYLSLKKSCRFKAAVVTAGMANAFINIRARPEMETSVFSELVADYNSTKEQSLKERSVVFWADQLCKTTPLLIMHGSADWRVLPEESLELVQKLFAARHPLRFILFEGADHAISEWRKERLAQTKRHFDYYVRDLNKWPSLEPHGN